MGKPPALAGTSVRGWDIYVGSLVVVLALYARTVVNGWLVLTPIGVLGLWYLVAGRRALITHQMRWAVAYVVGNVVMFPAAAALQPWVAPTLGFVLPLVWWLLLPNRRWAIIAMVAIVVAESAGLLIYALTWIVPETHKPPWTTSTIIIAVGIIPAVIIAVGVVGGSYVDGVFRWGQERVDLVDDLRATESQRIALEREAAAAEERFHLSQEIHDTVAQDVAGLRLLVERARRQVDQAAGKAEVAEAMEPVSRTLDMISTGVDAVLVETRELITANAPVPAGSSFKEAVERIGNRFAQETDITVDMDVIDTRLPRESEVVFIRCLQEGLSNVRRHAHATRVWIWITTVADVAVMTLTDNGVGLEPGAASGFGLPGMAERVRQAGGSFSVESPGPHLGVIVRVRMPVRAVPTATEAASTGGTATSHRGEGAS